MPLSTIDPTPALVIIDLQKGILGLPTAHPADEAPGKAASLVDAFRTRACAARIGLSDDATIAPGITHLIEMCSPAAGYAGHMDEIPRVVAARLRPEHVQPGTGTPRRDGQHT
jgi:hypothetical protein